MAIPVIKIKNDSDSLYAPYSGLVLNGEGGEVIADLIDKAGEGVLEEILTMLFFYISETMDYMYVHPKLREQFNLEESDIEPSELCNALSADSSIAFHHDAGWSGETWWAFGKI